MRNILLLLVFFLSYPAISLASFSEYKGVKADTAEINRVIALCKDSIYFHPDSVSFLLDQVLVVSTEMNYEYGLYNTHNLKGIVYWMTHDLDEATIHYKKALTYSNSSEHPRRKAIVLGNLGLVYMGLYNYDSANVYLEKAIAYSHSHELYTMETKARFDRSNLYLEQDDYIKATKALFQVRDSLEKSNNTKLLIYTYGTLGILFTHLDKPELALENYWKSIRLDENYKEINNLAGTYINLGEFYFNVMNDYDSAAFYYRKALEFALPYNQKNITLSVNVNLGNAFLEKKMYDSAFVKYQKVLSDSLIYSYPGQLAAVTVNMGIYHLRVNNLTEARNYLQSGLEMTKKLEILRFEINALKTIYILDSLEGNFENAFYSLKNYNKAVVKLNEDEVKKALLIFEFDKYTERQKFDKALLEKGIIEQSQVISNQRKWITGAFIGVLLLLIFSYVLYSNKVHINKLNDLLIGKNQDLKTINNDLTNANNQLNIHEQELKELNLTKDKFFSILGHDLKGPFNSLLGLLSIIDEQWDTMDDRKKHFLIKELYASSNKTHNLLENLLNWRKAKDGLIKCSLEQLNLKEKIMEVIGLFNSEAQRKGIKLLVEVESNTMVNIDTMLFSQIIQNLVNNAIKFTESDGVVTIKSEVLANKTEICITDTGIGIPKKHIAGVFDINTNFNRPGTDGEKSSGMGLILAKEYATLLGAELTVESEENVGSTFCILLN
jgi:signal transduction histidine kinase